ncbi:transposase [Streptomyces sp. NPDC090741]|uniref:transposase n=1 Tax=Streptomyces sp. NPDC090741 TaxID=3365967 RepID=UPI00381C98EF
MREAVAATRTTLTVLPGLGTVPAAKVIGHIGDVSRFPTEHHFASYTGSAPLDASSGNNVRHRLNTGGNRALNSVLHTIAGCQIRDGGRGQDYYLRKVSEGKTPAEASPQGPETASVQCGLPDHETRPTDPPRPSRLTPLDTQWRHQVMFHLAGAMKNGPRQPDGTTGRQPSRASVSGRATTTGTRYEYQCQWLRVRSAHG